MSKNFWIGVRILGWTLMLVWFSVYGIDLLLENPIQWKRVTNFFVGAIGTFLVLTGYYKLTRKSKK